MSGAETQINFSEISMPPRKGRLETYLWDHGDEVTEAFAPGLHKPERPMQAYGVMIPVAAHQESAVIDTALSQYALQEGADPFTICLLLNYPAEIEETAIEPSIAAVESAIEKYPQLDIRYLVSAYDSSTTIGQIRKDLWDSVLRVVLAEGMYDTPSGEFIGINHDIDTLTISRHYMRNVQRHYAALQSMLDKDDMSAEPLVSRFTQVKHAYPFATHPNVARVIFWNDFTARQRYRGGTYEEGMVIPLSYYCQQGGFELQERTHETSPLTPERMVGIPGTGMETSPRRYIMRLGENALQSIWSKESFTPTDACRIPTALPPDISHAAMEERIFEHLEQDLAAYCAGVPREQWEKIRQPHVWSGFFNELDMQKERPGMEVQIGQLLRKRLMLAQNVLERIIDSPLLADTAEGYLNHFTGFYLHLMEAAIQREIRLVLPR